MFPFCGCLNLAPIPANWYENPSGYVTATSKDLSFILSTLNGLKTSICSKGACRLCCDLSWNKLTNSLWLLVGAT